MAENITDYVWSCVEDYKRFVGIDDFPAFDLKSKEITEKKALEQGSDALATAFYDTSTGKHTLEIWSKLCLPRMNAEYIMFHEFTHIWDAEVYSQKENLKHTANGGYTEYHAAQIDFMKLLGAMKINEPFSFSINQKFETVGGIKTGKEYVNMSRNLATALISRKDFPANIGTLVTAMGAIFNYYGRRSICKMYAVDYDDEADTSVIAQFLGENTINALDAFMIDWLDKEKISLIDEFYGRVIVDFVKKNKFI